MCDSYPAKAPASRNGRADWRIDTRSGAASTTLGDPQPAFTDVDREFPSMSLSVFRREDAEDEDPPPAPRDRLDLLVQGSILHEALAELSRAPVLGVAVFDAVFTLAMEKARIPRTYRTEAVRLELLRHFEAFLDDHRVTLGWKSRVEEQFRFALNPLVTISGRIDR